jgi:TonB-dependent SusC/RagA subfamily outer membrane receptor
MNQGLISTPIDALMGKVPGLVITQAGGSVLGTPTVRVRGTSSLSGGSDPLVIIDGIFSDMATFQSLPVSDIKEVSLLKDASETAQYGSRGAAGVIEVATKKGKAEKFHIAYSGTIGFESIYKNIEMLNASDFRSAAKAMGKDITDMGYDTDFTKVPTRTGYVHNHHIAFGGGSEIANYRVSMGVQDHRTVIKHNRYRNYSAKIDVTQMAFENRLTVDLGVFGSLQKDDYVPFPQKLFYSAATFNPTFADGKNASGGYDNVPEAQWISNPNALMDVQDDANNAHVNAHLRAKVNLGYGLTLQAFGSFSYNNIHSGHYYPTYVTGDGEAYRREMKNEEQLGNLSLNWDKRMGKHHLTMLFLSEARKTSQKGFYTTATKFSTDAFGYDNLSAGAIRPWDGTNSF